MARTRTRVEGLRSTLRRINLLPARFDRARVRALDQWAEELKKTAKGLAPVRTGYLRSHIEVRTNRRSGKAWVGVWDRKATKYAYYVEKGTSKMRDQPYLGPAAQINRRSGERLLARSVEQEIRRL